MKIVIAPDSFKESLSALQVAQAIEQGFREIFPQAELVLVPMADGGEGTVDAILAAGKGDRVVVDVTGPLGQRVSACFGWLSATKMAVIEMSAASGLHLIAPQLRDPRMTSSYGTGELILAALDCGVETIVLGIGGSATNDGGAGMMQALGARFLDAQGQVLPSGGSALAALDKVDLTALDPRLQQTTIHVACDVENPLWGSHGASVVFGPQKGATPSMIPELDQALCHYGEKIYQTTGRWVSDQPGAGAAGGMGAAFLGLLNLCLQSGVETVIQAVKLAEVVQGADLVVTGEGCIDSQTICGKTPIGVARVAKRFNIPVIALAGSMTTDYQGVHQHGLDAVFSILNRITTLPEALMDAHENVRVTARNVAAVWKMGLNNIL